VRIKIIEISKESPRRRGIFERKNSVFRSNVYTISMSPQSDQELVYATLKDPDAYIAIVDRYEIALSRYVGRMI
jgi:hypothetical protein